MSYAILHMQKLKQPAIKGIQIHNQREKESQTNADIRNELSHLNYDLVNPKSIDYNEKVNKMIEEGVTTGKAIRKDAVKVASFLVTSDSEYFQNLSDREERRFFESAYEFFADEYGEKNIAYAMVHKDEKTPHMHVGFVPITEDGRLSAKDFFGKKQQLAKLQDKFHDHMVREGFNLERGVSTDRKHVESAKYKALTLQQMEKDAKEKYERTIGQIHEITDKTKAIENIESKKVLGLVGMKEQDYQSLVDYATNGVIYQVKAENLEKDLEKAKKEVEQLKSDMQIGQDKVRHYYKHIEENLDSLVKEKVIEKMKKTDIVKKYENLIEKYNGLVNKYNDQLKEKTKLVGERDTLKFENQSYQRENRDLKLENGKLKDKYLELANEFSSFKKRVVKVLFVQIDRVKRFLRLNDVDHNKIKLLEDKRNEIVQDSLQRLEKPENQKREEMEMER
ncbi:MULTISPECIES: MobV family relaxase [Bacillaceae]|uniref:MobV family relaxase n=1 Tax=Bacillaceae TaxID=186817 RepID=UPI0009D21D84|nr:Plasmid recombination enzyme [Mycobacteroides abscessus subsp. abscessus]